jgi:putative glycosyltransferase (TIGR04348 family)
VAQFLSALASRRHGELPDLRALMTAKPLKISIITPAPRGSRKGNRVSAERYARLLRQLGHRVRVLTAFDGKRADVAIVLHARRCAADLRAIRAAHPDTRVVLCLTGTDVYEDIHSDKVAAESLRLADRLLLLQPLARKQLPSTLRARADVVFQSVDVPVRRIASRANRVAVVGHVRDVKDPLRAARAIALLPQTRLSVTLAGSILEPHWGDIIAAEQAANPRFRYVGELSRARALSLIAGSRALVVSSLLEGGANVISEACVLGTPVLASRVDGNVGMLGPNYPGYFRAGDSKGLAKLLRKLEAEPSFERALASHCKRLASQFHPDKERTALARMLRKL